MAYHDKHPPSKVRVTSVIGRLGHSESDEEGYNKPPARNGLVNLHFLVVFVVSDRCVLIPGVHRTEERLKLSPVEEEDVNGRRAHGKIVRDERQGVSGGEPCGANLGVFRRVKAVVCEDSRLVVLGAVRVEDRLGHEREILRMPYVSVVDCRLGIELTFGFKPLVDRDREGNGP